MIVVFRIQSLRDAARIKDKAINKILLERGISPGPENAAWFGEHIRHRHEGPKTVYLIQGQPVFSAEVDLAVQEIRLERL